MPQPALLIVVLIHIWLIVNLMLVAPAKPLGSQKRLKEGPEVCAVSTKLAIPISTLPLSFQTASSSELCRPGPADTSIDAYSLLTYRHS
jgi:hypothetical protein